MNIPNDNRDLQALADMIVDRMTLQSPTPNAESGFDRSPLLTTPASVINSDPRTLFGATLGIAGVEFTQSIQHHGAVGVSYGDDNSVPLVAYKTLVARACPFVRRGQLGGDLLTGQRVTGELTLSIGNRVIYRTGPTRADGARVGALKNLDRTLWDQELTLSAGGPGEIAVRTISINAPLNFVVPAGICRRGQIYAALRLWTVDPAAQHGSAAQASQMLQFLDVPAPRVCLVRVNWDDGAGTITKPSDTAMLATLRLAERMLPFPYFDTTILSTEVTSAASYWPAATGGGCNAAWSSLVASLAVTRIFTALFQLGDIVFGMVPNAAIPPSAKTINAGCGRAAGGGFVGYDTTFAHEIGHLYQRRHVAVPGDPTNDTDYPKYGGSARSIGEVGIDTGTSPPTLFDPGTSDDIMSYGKNQWISPYTYRRVLEARDLHQSSAIDTKRLRNFLFIEFRLLRVASESERVELKRAARVTAPGLVPKPAHATESPLSIDLHDANGRILSTHHCFYVPAHAHGCGCGCGSGTVPLDREPWLDFHEVIEWPDEDVAQVSFHSGSDAFHRIEIGEAPSLGIEGPEFGEDLVKVRVFASHSYAEVSVIVLFSADDGENWQPVAFDPPDGQVEVPAERLAGGEQCVFRAIATAQLQSASADTERFALPRLPRRVHIVTPPQDCGIAAGDVALSAMLDTRGHGALAPQEIRWSSSIEGELGAGYDLTTHLSEGEHELMVTAPDGIGGTLSERAIIIVGGSPQRR